jgi:DnaK suppressor protein
MATALNEVFGSEAEFVLVPKGYRPGANEDFMNPLQLAYFRQKLLAWKEDVVKESRETMAQLKTGPIREADLTDRASSESDWSIELRTRDRQRKLIAKIDAALRRIDEGEYGYCEVTGEPIALAREAGARFARRLISGFEAPDPGASSPGFRLTDREALP